MKVVLLVAIAIVMISLKWIEMSMHEVHRRLYIHAREIERLTEQANARERA